MNSTDEANKAIEHALHLLGEHFEAVQILATRTIEGRSHCAKRGTGNWYARQGMAQEFIQQACAEENAIQLVKRLSPPEE